MVALPLFKLAALFVRHISKYGASRIKVRAHEHPEFRKFAARYGQHIHQLNMRLSVALLRKPEAEKRARELAEAPTVKTKEQVEREEEKKRKAAEASSRGSGGSGGSGGGGSKTDGASSESLGSTPTPLGRGTSFLGTSPWRRQFRPLPEAKAVDLFADVAGDAFILLIASALLLFEYYRTATKPDTHAERLRALSDELAALRAEALRRDTRLEHRMRAVEAALRSHHDPRTKRPLLPPHEPHEAAHPFVAPATTTTTTTEPAPSPAEAAAA